MTVPLQRPPLVTREPGRLRLSRWPDVPGLALGALVALIVAVADARALLELGGVRTWVLYELALTMLAVVALVVVCEAGSPRVRPADLALTGIGAALLALVIWRPTVDARGWLHLLVGWSAFYVAHRASCRRLRVGGLLLVLLVVVAIGEALYAIAQGQGSYPTPAGGVEASGTLYNPNHLAGLLNLGLMLTLGGLLYALLPPSKPKPWSERLGLAWLALMACGALCLALFYTRSRGGWLACATALSFAAAILIAGGRDRFLRRAGLTTAVVLVLAAGAGVIALGPDRIVGRFVRPDDPSSRWQQYEDTLSMIAEKPLLGVGPGMYSWHFRRHQTDTPRSLYQHAHNDYLQSAAELGVPLAAAWWTFVVFVLVRDLRAFADSRSRVRRSLLFAGATAIVAMLVHSLVDFNLQLPSHLVMFAAILGVAAAAGRRSAQPEEESDARVGPWAGIVASTVALALVVGAAWRVSTRLEAEYLLRRELDLAHVEQAARMDDDNAEAHFRLGLAFRDGMEHNDPERARHELERAVELHPHRWPYQLELAWLHELQGRPADAERALLEAVRLNPRAAEYRWRLANFYIRGGDLRRAAPELTLAVAGDPDLGPAALSLAIKTAGGDSALASIWPQDAASRVGLLRMVCGSGKRGQTPALLALARTESEALFKQPRELSIVDASVAVSCLLDRSEPSAARAAWIDLMSAHGMDDPSFRTGGNLVWNGGFELPITGGALDWRRPDRGGSFARATSIDDGAGGMGLSLGVGVGNAGRLPFLEQVVPVEPGQAYVLRLRLRGAGGAADEHDVAKVVAEGGKELVGIERGALGDREWSVREARFRAPAGPAWLRVRLYAASTTFGVAPIVIDDVELRDAPVDAAN